MWKRFAYEHNIQINRHDFDVVITREFSIPLPCDRTTLAYHTVSMNPCLSRNGSIIVTDCLAPQILLQYVCGGSVCVSEHDEYLEGNVAHERTVRGIVAEPVRGSDRGGTTRFS